MKKFNKELRQINGEVYRTYIREMNEFLSKNKGPELLETDVQIMIMNLTISISRCLYFSLKKFLPKSELDFDFMRAAILNNLKDEFEEIKNHDSDKSHVELTHEQIKEIFEKGYITLTIDGMEVKFTKEDLEFKEVTSIEEKQNDKSH